MKLARLPEPPIPTTTDIEDGFKGIRDVMNAVPQYFVGLEIATVNYCDLVTHPGGENRLIARLRSAKKATGSSEETQADAYRELSSSLTFDDLGSASSGS